MYEKNSESNEMDTESICMIHWPTSLQKIVKTGFQIVKYITKDSTYYVCYKIHGLR